MSRQRACDHDAVLEVIKMGFTYTQIAKRLGVSVGVISRIARRHGYEKRNDKTDAVRAFDQTFVAKFSEEWNAARKTVYKNLVIERPVVKSRETAGKYAPDFSDWFTREWREITEKLRRANENSGNRKHRCNHRNGFVFSQKRDANGASN